MRHIQNFIRLPLLTLFWVFKAPCAKSSSDFIDHSIVGDHCANPITFAPFSSWRATLNGVLNFHDRYGWDENSQTYSSYLDVKGTETHNVRTSIAVGQMIFVSARSGNVLRARSLVNFLLNHMVTYDLRGMMFLPAVLPDGRHPPERRNFIFIEEQAYAIAGLLSFYLTDRQQNADLLPMIRESIASFWARFYDEKRGGFYSYYNLINHKNQSDLGVESKSFSSIVQPLTLFLFDWYEEEGEKDPELAKHLRSLLVFAERNLVARRDNKVTGFSNDFLNVSGEASQASFVSSTGNVMQLAWAFQQAAEKNLFSQSDSDLAHTLKTRSRELLSSTLAKGALSPSTGCLIDSFDTRNDRPLLNSLSFSSSWWTNLNGIIAFHLAQRDLEEGPTKKSYRDAEEKLTECYHKFFIDSQAGGEFYSVEAHSGKPLNTNKAFSEKSPFHLALTEMWVRSQKERSEM